MQRDFDARGGRLGRDGSGQRGGVAEIERVFAASFGPGGGEGEGDAVAPKVGFGRGLGQRAGRRFIPLGFGVVVGG